MKPKIMIMLPTYNERKNIRIIAKTIFRYAPQAEIVVVDDNSPDRTAEEVRKLAKKDKRVHLLLRTRDKGRGYAGRDGFLYCLKHKADIVIEMDADLSHNPKYIPELLNYIKKYDVVIGSRFVPGASDSERSVFRRTITYLANYYIRALLGVGVHDCNSGYRCFRRTAMKAITPELLFSKDADTVQEVLYKLILTKQSIKEIPIAYEERKYGETTKKTSDYLRGLYIVLKLKLLHTRGKLWRRGS